MDAGWVAGQIETSRRREVLSWSHHREVAGLVQEEQGRCAEIKLRAERRAGELLAEREKNPGQLRRGSTMEPRAKEKTLADDGITKKQSHRWQAVATVPEKKSGAARDPPAPMVWVRLGLRGQPFSCSLWGLLSLPPALGPVNDSHL